jgi:hypothetical protein
MGLTLLLSKSHARPFEVRLDDVLVGTFHQWLTQSANPVPETLGIASTALVYARRVHLLLDVRLLEQGARESVSQTPESRWAAMFEDV